MLEPMEHPLLKQILRLRQRGEGETVRWKGSKHPRRVWWTRGYLETAEHGILRDIGGHDVGTYRRVVEFGGPQKDEHEITAWPRE